MVSFSMQEKIRREQSESLLENEFENQWFFLQTSWFQKNFTLQECSGCFGDFGTFIPLTIGLAKEGRIDFSYVLLCAGVQHLTTVFWCHAPIAVQPFHAMATQMILDDSVTYDDLITAGLMIGGAMLFLSATNLISIINEIIPLSIVRGIQLGLGVGLMQKALKAVLKLPIDRLDSPWLALATIFICLLSTRVYRRFPASLFFFIVGLIIAVATHSISLTFGMTFSNIIRHPTQNWNTTVLNLFLPQLPVSTLNAVIATAKLLQDIFPERPNAGVREISASIGINNLVLPWFGAFPSCHGAGGLAGQVLFGARSNMSMLLLGILQIVLALCFGNSLINILKFFPISILEVLLFMTGLELATHVKDLYTKEDWIICLVTAAGSLYKNSGIGFVFGFTFACFDAACSYMEAKPQRESTI